MSGAERARFDVLRRVMRGELRQARAAELLGIGVRQVKRLVRSYRCEGEASVVSRRRGRPSNNRLDAAKIATIEATLRTRYADFGATLASEKLRETEGVWVSKETIRPGIVDQRVDRSEFALGRLGDLRRCFSFADVSVNQRELVRRVERGRLRDVSRTRDHVVTAAEEALHEARSDPLRAAGHDHCLLYACLFHAASRKT
jgi:transposase